MPINLEEKFEYGLNQISQAASWVISVAQGHKIWCFSGEMGSGKTTLIQEICRQLGVVGNISSPSFALVNEYVTHSSTKVFHFDFYRIKSEEEAYDIGYDMYFNSGEICLIEWPQKISEILSFEPHIQFDIQLLENKREISIHRDL